MIDTLY